MRSSDVPNGPLLVDTDVFSYLFARKGPFEAFAELTQGRELAISFATLGEALALGHKLRLGELRMAQLRLALERFVVLPYDRAVVEAWAPLHAKLTGQLHGGGANDLWTAACALTQVPPLPVATNNLNDFRAISRQVPSLRLIHPDL